MRAVILAGGLGTRLSEETAVKPKPMVEIGGRPILWHIMKIFGAAGVTEFVIAAGYRSEVIKNYFLHFHELSGDLTVDLATGERAAQAVERPPWKVHVVDTGIETQTGGRLRRLRTWLPDDTFLMTYGDGVADIDMRQLIRFHMEHGRLATVTAVRPPARFGALELDADRVTRFAEKMHGNDVWINGGFFVLNRKVLDYVEGDSTAWEQEPVERLSSEGELMAFRHRGFWQPMDTLREKHQLEAMWASGSAPWAR